MSFNYISEPPYPSTHPLSQEEARVGRILTNNHLRAVFIRTFLDTPETLHIRQHYAFLFALNSYHHLLRGALLCLTGGPGNPIDTRLAVYNLEQLHRSIISNTDESVRALLALKVKDYAPTLLYRQENPITDIRSENVCTSCGYSGHYPLECFYWICTVCHRPHPHHKSIDCPARPENQTNRSPEENPEETNETTTLPVPNLETTQESSLRTPSASPHPESSQERPTAPPTSSPELPNSSEHRTRLQLRNHRLQTISHPATRSSSQRRVVRVQFGTASRIPRPNRYAVLDTEDSSESGEQQEQVVNGRLVSGESGNSSA